MKVLVVYDSKYGNTRLVAEKIMEGTKEVEGLETSIGDVKEVDLKTVADYDAILIGAPVHFGGPSRAITRFIDMLGKIDLKAQWTSVFDTSLKTDFEKGVIPMEARIHERVPRLEIIVHGLSIEVNGIKGPIAEGELPKCIDFGKRIASKLEA